MKFFFKLFMAIHIGLYRLTGGKLGGSMMGSRILLLNTTGHKSGKAYTTPLGSFNLNDGYVIVASNAGQSTHPGWYFNLVNNPHVTVQLLDKVLSVTAEVLTGDARAQAWQKIIAISPNYADYEKRTSREIPLVLLRLDK